MTPWEAQVRSYEKMAKEMDPPQPPEEVAEMMSCGSEFLPAGEQERAWFGSWSGVRGIREGRIRAAQFVPAVDAERIAADKTFGLDVCGTGCAVEGVSRQGQVIWMARVYRKTTDRIVNKSAAWSFDFNRAVYAAWHLRHKK